MISVIGSQEVLTAADSPWKKDQPMQTTEEAGNIRVWMARLLVVIMVEIIAADNPGQKTEAFRNTRV